MSTPRPYLEHAVIVTGPVAVLWARLFATPNVAAVLCGHAHTAATTTFAGRPVVVAPGVVSTAVLPFENSTTLDYLLPPAVAFHILDSGRLTTHFRSL